MELTLDINKKWPKKVGVICASALAVGLAPFAHAQESLAASSLDQVVVTATRLPQTRLEANANINVVTRQDIERMHMTSLEEALRTVPGTQFLNYNLPGYNLSRVRINGTDQVLVLVDGVNATMLGSGVPYPLHFLSDMENIERIEVLRGSAAVLYGSNAKGGVINIITRRADERNHTRLMASAGSYDTQNYALSNEGTVGEWSYRINLSKFLQDSTRDAHEVKWAGHQDYEKGGAMVSRKVGTGSRVTLAFNTDRNNYSLLDHIYDQDIDGLSRTRDVTLTYDAAISDSLRNTFTARNSLFQNHGILHSDFGDADFWNDHHESRSFSNHLSRVFGHRNVLIAGAEYLKTTSLEPDFTGRYLSMSNRSVFLQDEWQVVSGLTATAGVRLDRPHSDRANLTSNTSRSAKVGYTFGPADKAYVAANDYFVLPSGFQLFSDFGNPRLLPEKGRNYEVGYSHVFGANAELSAHYFRRKSHQNIGFDNNARTYTNGEEKAEGADLQFDAKLSQNFSASLAYSFLNYDNAGGTTAYGYLPRNLINASLIWKDAAWNIGLDVRAFLGRDGNQVQADAWPSAHYWVANLGVNYQASQYLSLFVKINNLTDTLYAEHTNVIWAQFGGADDWYGMPGRNVLTGITLRL
jgi:vitamin B12 transporter